MPPMPADDDHSSHAPAAQEAIIYARVSSTKQTTLGDGLNSQVTRCTEYARYKGYRIAEIFKDDSSGSLIDRPGMKAMLAFLKTKPAKTHVVIIDDISRLARGLEAHLALRAALNEAGGILESPSIEFGEDSDSQLVENMLAAVSQHHRQKNGEQTKNRMRARCMNGYWVFRAPIGYRYEKRSGQGKVLIRHEPLASVIQEALEGFASGRFETQAEVLRFFETLSYFPRDARGVIRFERIKDILTNPLYAGMVEAKNWKVTIRPGQHEGLISYDAFLKIQDRLSKKPKAPIRKNIGQDFALRGFITCGDCGTLLTSSWSTGRSKRYPYYHCQERRCVSYGKSIRRAEIEDGFEALLTRLQPSASLMRVASSIFKDAWAARQAIEDQHIAQFKKDHAAHEAAIEKLLGKILETENARVAALYEQRLSEIEGKKLQLQEKISAHEKQRQNHKGRHQGEHNHWGFEETFGTAMHFLANPATLWGSGTFAMRRTVLKLTFADRLSYHRGKGFGTALPSLPFQVIQRLERAGAAEANPNSKMVPPVRLERTTY